MNNKYLHLVSVTDRKGHQLFPLNTADRDPSHTPRLIAKRLLATYDRNIEIKRLISPSSQSASPSLIPCPRNPHHTARLLVGNTHMVWCPRCREIISIKADLLTINRVPFYAALGLLAVWLVAISVVIWSA